MPRRSGCAAKLISNSELDIQTAEALRQRSVPMAVSRPAVRTKTPTMERSAHFAGAEGFGEGHLPLCVRFNQIVLAHIQGSMKRT